jgi:hypothetical protein
VIGFLPELRPAWWVVRGDLAVQAASVAISLLDANLGGLSFPVPRLLGSQVLGLLAVAAAVTGSVALFPFDADGKPLRDVYLVDQDGRPVVATHEDTPWLDARLPLDRDGNKGLHRYPQTQT